MFTHMYKVDYVVRILCSSLSFYIEGMDPLRVNKAYDYYSMCWCVNKLQKQYSPYPTTDVYHSQMFYHLLISPIIGLSPHSG